MNQFKKVQVIMLPTENNTNLLLCIKDYTEIRECDDEWGKKGDIIEDFKINKLYLGDSEKCNLSIFSPQHLYIISNDKIKEGNWAIVDYVTGFTDLNGQPCNEGELCLVQVKDVVLGNVEHGKELLFHYEGFTHELKFCKKIIATTDNSLIFEGTQDNIRYIKPYPQLSQKFIIKYIEEYNKTNKITDVLVEYELIPFSTSFPDRERYERIKVNPDNTITIKESKDNWNREEVIKILYNFAEYCQKHDDNSYKSDKWIKENL